MSVAVTSKTVRTLRQYRKGMVSLVGLEVGIEEQIASLLVVYIPTIFSLTLRLVLSWSLPPAPPSSRVRAKVDHAKDNTG